MQTSHFRLQRLFIFVWSSVLIAMPNATAQVQSDRSADFVSAVGVNVHWSYPDFSDNHTFYVQKVIDLGVGYVRDATTAQAYATAKNELGPAGIKTLFLTGRRFAGSWPQKLDPGQITSEIDDIAAIPVAYVCGIEGPNEYDISKPSSDVDWAATVRDYSTKVFARVKATASFAGIPVIGPSFTSEQAYNSVGSMDNIIDAPCVHLYQSNRHPGSGGWGNNGYGSIDWGLQYGADKQSPAHKRPVWSTECGYRQEGTQRVNEAVYDKYTLRMCAEYFRKGLNPCIYMLANDVEEMGLVNSAKQERAAFKSVKALMALCKDPGATFTPGLLSYSLTGNKTDIREVLLQKSNGDYLLLVWLESEGWDPNSYVEKAVAARPMTLNVPASIKSVRVVDFNVDGSTAETTPSMANGQVALLIPDRIQVVRLIGGTVGAIKRESSATLRSAAIVKQGQLRVFDIRGRALRGDSRHLQGETSGLVVISGMAAERVTRIIR